MLTNIPEEEESKMPVDIVLSKIGVMNESGLKK
jgi:hypothetical protein